MPPEPRTRRTPGADPGSVQSDQTTDRLDQQGIPPKSTLTTVSHGRARLHIRCRNETITELWVRAGDIENGEPGAAEFAQLLLACVEYSNAWRVSQRATLDAALQVLRAGEALGLAAAA
jgi:hypothetical protein